MGLEIIVMLLHIQVFCSVTRCCWVSKSPLLTQQHRKKYQLQDHLILTQLFFFISFPNISSSLLFCLFFEGIEKSCTSFITSLLLVTSDEFIFGRPDDRSIGVRVLDVPGITAGPKFLGDEWYFRSNGIDKTRGFCWCAGGGCRLVTGATGVERLVQKI